eukprot:scaffold71977_cov51-Phaeocystis_antarctica.AAC.1
MLSLGRGAHVRQRAQQGARRAALVRGLASGVVGGGGAARVRGCSQRAARVLEGELLCGEEASGRRLKDRHDAVDPGVRDTP